MFGREFGKKLAFKLPSEFIYRRVFHEGDNRPKPVLTVKEFRGRLYARCGIPKKQYWPFAKDLIHKGFIRYNRGRGLIKPLGKV